MDWQLTLFRLGLLACLVGVLFAATQFDIARSLGVVWNHSPTTTEMAVATATAAQDKVACLAKKAKTTEYASICDLYGPAFRGPPREKALANVQGFLITSLVEIFLVFAVSFLGLRMARKAASDKNRQSVTADLNASM